MVPHGRWGVALAGLREARSEPLADPRQAMAWAQRAGFGAVQLDATCPGTRPRELDRSARRDLAATLRRLELTFCGLDLWIPPRHFVDPARQERALEALAQALGLAVELARRSHASAAAAVVSVVLPRDRPAEVNEAIDAMVGRVGGRVADHAWPPTEAQPAADRDTPVGWGVDPAAVIAAGQDVVEAVSGRGRGIVAARLSDIAAGHRVAAGEGELDVMSYLAALNASGFGQAVVVDTRGVAEPAPAALRVLARLGWRATDS